jgi:hypothetical protein
MTGLCINLIAGLAYVVLVIGMGFFGLWDPEKKAMDRWKTVLTPKVCPHCGNESRSDDKFCPQCGTGLPLLRVQKRSASPASGHSEEGDFDTNLPENGSN